MNVSVIIPTLNEEFSIQNVLGDLKNQTVKVHEILVIDGGSADQTVKSVRKTKCVKLIVASAGIAHQRNIGGMKATGDILIFLDADVRIAADFIEKVILFMNTTNAAIACPRYVPYPGSLMINGVYTFLHMLFWIFSGITPSGAGSCIIVRSSVYQRIKGFNEVLIFDDIHFIRSASRIGKFRMMPISVAVSDRRFRTYGVIPVIATYGILSVMFFFGLYRLANLIPYPFGRYHKTYAR